MTEIRLRHLPFYEVLASSPSETSAQWRAANAGLLVMRLVDRALTDVERVTARELAGVHLALRAVEQGDATAPVIRRTLQALEAEDIGRIALALRDLGRVYVSSAAWAIGRDVYATGAEAAQIAERDELVLQCLSGEGHAIRMLRDFEVGTLHYARMQQVAVRMGDMRYQLEAQLGLAKLTIDRGDLKGATARLDRLIDRARQADCVVVHSKALHDRARVAGEMGDYAGALDYAYEALQSSEDPRERDRILADVSRALTLVGERAAARDGCLVLAATAQEQEIRWMATIHLMELASLDGREAEFDHHRVQLAAERLPPATAAWYHQVVGAGSATLGRWEEAHDALLRMRAESEEHRLAKSVIEADDALEQLEVRRRAAARAATAETSVTADTTPATPSVRVRWVASEVTRLRESAGLAV